MQPCHTQTTDTQRRHKSKISEKLGQCGRQNMLRPYLKIWGWDWIFGREVKAISSLRPCPWCHIKFIYSEKATKILLNSSTSQKKVEISQNFVAFLEYMNFNIGRVHLKIWPYSDMFDVFWRMNIVIVGFSKCIWLDAHWIFLSVQFITCMIHQ